MIPSGVIDVLTKSEVIEANDYKNWKNGIGQVIAYGFYFLLRTKRVHLFADTGDMRVPKCVELATSVGSTHGIHAT